MMLVSLTHTNILPGFNLSKLIKKIFLYLWKDGRNYSGRQEIKNIYQLSTCFYYAKRFYNEYKKEPSFVWKKFAFFVKRNAIDLDDPIDLISEIYE